MARQLIDIQCPECGNVTVDVFVDRDAMPNCHLGCGGVVERAWIPGSTAGVVGDDIPGGLAIRHGLCHADGSPRTFYSKSEIAREAKARGIQQRVEHVGSRGSDKAPHTQRWL